MEEFKAGVLPSSAAKVLACLPRLFLTMQERKYDIT
jgi:hypothetical protein